MCNTENACNREPTQRGCWVGSLIVRPRACFHCEVFRVPKNVTLKTNKPPAMRVVEIALAYSIKPPML